MKIYDTLSRQKKIFQPIDPTGKKVGMYVCGPTVYDVGHLGHARSAVAFDIVRRYLIYKGYEVIFVSNITDVDDKMIMRAQKEQITEKQLAEKIIPEYAHDYGALRVLPPTYQPRATEYIPQMVQLIETLIEKGAAYVTEDGVYFRVNTRSDYGKLSGQNIQELRSGSRIAVDEKKEQPEDFAVWKKAKEGEPTWPGPQGISGRPGWHIECSAMSAELLGETFDIHGGGIDLVFPHHEDEIAQSESATGKPFARYWLHNGHVQVHKEKMSKSLGNFFTIKDMLAKWNPLVLRYFLLSTHYRLPIDFSDELLVQAQNSLTRIHDFVSRLTSYKSTNSSLISIATELQEAAQKFEDAMDEDFEIVSALAALFDLIRTVNRAMDEGTLSEDEAQDALQLFNRVDTVFAILPTEVGAIDDEIESLIQEREAARASKNFVRSDEIRTLLTSKGILLEDTPQGIRWKRKL